MQQKAIKFESRDKKYSFEQALTSDTSTRMHAVQHITSNSMNKNKVAIV